MVAELHDPELTKSIHFSNAGVDMSFNFNFTHIEGVPTGKTILFLVDKWFDRMEEKWPNWVVSRTLILHGNTISVGRSQYPVPAQWGIFFGRRG